MRKKPKLQDYESFSSYIAAMEKYTAELEWIVDQFPISLVNALLDIKKEGATREQTPSRPKPIIKDTTSNPICKVCGKHQWESNHYNCWQKDNES